MCVSVSDSELGQEEGGGRESEWEEEARQFSRELYSQTQPGIRIPHQRHHI